MPYTEPYKGYCKPTRSAEWDDGPRATLYIVAVQLATRTVLEYVRLRNRSPERAIEIARSRHDRHAHARIVGARVGD